MFSTRMPALAPSSLSARASRTPTSRYPMLPTYTKGSPGLASEYVFAVATMSWLWTRNLRVGGLRFVTRLPKPSIQSTRGPDSGSGEGGSARGPSDSIGTPAARAAAAGADTPPPSNRGRAWGPGASPCTRRPATASAHDADNPLVGPTEEPAP